MQDNEQLRYYCIKTENRQTKQAVKMAIEGKVVGVGVTVEEGVIRNLKLLFILKFQSLEELLSNGIFKRQGVFRFF